MGAPTFIGLGSNCYVSWTLRRAGLQTESLPLDWVNSFDFSKVHAFLTADPEDFLADLEPSRHRLDAGGEGRSLYAPTYDIRLPHEFDIDPEITLDGVRARLRRRIDRFWRAVHAADRLILVRALNDGFFAPRETFADALPSAMKWLDALAHLRAPPTMILFSHHDEAPVGVAGYNIALIDRAVPMDCGFYTYNDRAVSMEAADRLYRTFFWIPHFDAAKMAEAYKALMLAGGLAT